MAWLSKTLWSLILIIGLIESASSLAAVKVRKNLSRPVADEPVTKDAAVDPAEEDESCAADRSRMAYCVEFLQSGREARTCLDYLCRGRTMSGVYNVHPSGYSDYSLPVYCDQTTDGGGWTVFQRRMDGTVDFYRNWANYRLGFGELTAEHWLGNENLYILLSLHDVNELWIDMQSANDLTSYARYDNFSIASESDNYTLSVSGFLGTADAGDGLTPLNGASFAAKDKDDNTNCAQRFQAGGWWYGIDSQTCYDTNLNGFYRGTGRRSYSDGVNWKQWKGYYGSLTFSEMKFRPKISN